LGPRDNLQIARTEHAPGLPAANADRRPENLAELTTAEQNVLRRSTGPHRVPPGLGQHAYWHVRSAAQVVAVPLGLLGGMATWTPVSLLSA
jgi:hypothetical protein